MPEKILCCTAKPKAPLIVGSGMTILEVLIRGFLLYLYSTHNTFVSPDKGIVSAAHPVIYKAMDLGFTVFLNFVHFLLSPNAIKRSPSVQKYLLI